MLLLVTLRRYRHANQVLPPANLPKPVQRAGPSTPATHSFRTRYSRPANSQLTPS